LAKPFAVPELVAGVRALREPGRVFTRTELCERVWEHAQEYDTTLVEVFIGRLRKKVGVRSLIRIVRHVGYTICKSSALPASRKSNNRVTFQMRRIA